jgi:glycosyltransferase involved in cell wall biosynthesis
MKIIHIIPSLNMGGAEKFCVDLSNEMSTDNEVSIIVLHTVDKNSFLFNRLHKKVNFISFDKKLGLDFKLFFKIYFYLKKQKPDVINTHLSGLFYSILFCIFNKKISIFHTIHNEAKKETSALKRFINKQLYKFKLVQAVGISKRITKTIEEEYKLKNVPTIDNGTSKVLITQKVNKVYQEIIKLKKYPEQKILVNIARIFPQKNQELLIETVKEFDNLILIIIGEVTKENQTLYKKLDNISSNVHFLGVRDNIGDYLYHSDIFCLSSLFEGLPITLIEAMSLGKVCLSTPVGGIPDVIENKKNGFLTKDSTIENYTKTLREILDLNEIELKTIKKNAITTYEDNFSIIKTKKNYLNLYTKGNNV